MHLRRKIAPFIFGVSIGLLIGVGFFVFRINNWFHQLRDSASGNITVIQQPVKNVVVPEKKKNTGEKFKLNLGKSKKVNYKEVDSLIRDDSNISIATDELLSVKNIKPIIIGDNIAGADSGAAVLAHVSESTSPVYMVEFWKTPLNSKGFRFSKNKIMLYGFMDFNVVLYQLDNHYYVRSSDHVYRIYPTSEFRPLERVIDMDLLSKLS